MFSWYQKRDCTFILSAINRSYRREEREETLWSRTSIDIPEGTPQRNLRQGYGQIAKIVYVERDLGVRDFLLVSAHALGPC